MKTIGPALFQFLDDDNSGAISMAELLAAIHSPSLMDFVASVKCPVLTKLFHEDTAKVQKTMVKIDTGKSGDITFLEWMAFLNQVQIDRLAFYRQRCLLRQRVYMGLGMEPGKRWL
jgi:hypothetical protein